ncbi:hypothetical protein ACJJIF_03525 [Microbulbifer sp. SSSA002]|uniref:hypothetical protein n=1 Tax=Microbulbifer sp. SSSA002 TaxID=3243376 RepID=UPI00403A04DE
MLFGTVKNPKGPNLGKSKQVNYNLSGTKLNFVKPPTNISVPGVDPAEFDLPLELDLNIYALENFINLGGEGDAWGRLLAKEHYRYNGIPLWSPKIGGMEFYADLRRATKYPNLLEAAHYENWIDKDIKSYYAPGRASGSERWLYLFPLFWQTFKLPQTGNVQWVAYIVQDFCSRNGDQFAYHVRSAISSEHELVFSFRATSDEYDSGAFVLFKKIVRFILNHIEITLVESTEREIKELKKAGLRKFSTEKPICRYDNAPKNELGNYELLEDPCFYFTRIGKTIDRRLWVD